MPSPVFRQPAAECPRSARPCCFAAIPLLWLAGACALGWSHSVLNCQAAESELIAFTAALDLGSLAGQVLGDEQPGGIYVMRPDGTGLRQLTSFHTFNFRYEGDIFSLPDDHPSISPDGRKILFTTSRLDSSGVFGGVANPDNFELFIMDINGGNVRRLTSSPGFDGQGVFSPDGTRIAYVSNCGGKGGTDCPGNLDIYVMDLNGVVLQQVTSSLLSDVEPAWSPDGTRIVYTRVTDQGSPIITDEQKQLRIADADGLDKNDQLLFDNPGQDHDASFHPSGTELIVTSERDGTQPYGDVVRLRTDGTFLQNLTIDDRVQIGGINVGGGGDPAWSPSGTRIAYIKAVLGVLHGPQRIHIMNADGSNKRKLDEGIPGLLNIHQNWGRLVDTDGDGKPNYLENSNQSFPRESVAGFGLFGQQVANQSEPGEQFGTAVALADLTHDGWLDLVVGSPGLDDGGLISHVDSGGIASESESVTLTGSGGFGSALAAGDFNGDGKADLVVGSPSDVRAGVASGAVRVFFGTAGGLNQTPMIIDQGDLPTAADIGREEAGDRFGGSIAAGDLTGDGIADLVIGVPNEDIAGVEEAGLVYVVPGKAGQLLQLSQTVDRDARSLPEPLGGLQRNGHFGASLAVGKFRAGATPRSLIVGAPDHDVVLASLRGEPILTSTDAGIVAIFDGPTPVLGSGGVLGSNVTVLSAKTVGGVVQNSGRFGQTLAVGDTSGSESDSLVIGAPGHSPGGVSQAGEIFLVSGNEPSVQKTKPIICSFCSEIGFSLGVVQRITQAELGEKPEANDHFGGGLAFKSANAMAIGDMDKDGQADLFIGTGQENGSGIDTGLVSIRYGVDVGQFSVSPDRISTRPGEAVNLQIAWTHPEHWSLVDTVYVRFRNDEGVWTQFSFSLSDASLRFINSLLGEKGHLPALPSVGVLTDGVCEIRASDATVEGSGPEGRKVTLTVPIQFTGRAADQLFAVELSATDKRGNSQHWQSGGFLTVVAKPESLRMEIARNGATPDSLRLAAIGLPGKRIRFEASCDFQHWTPILVQENPIGLLFHNVSSVDALSKSFRLSVEP